MTILMEALENFWKLILLCKFHIFCILVALQCFDKKITFDGQIKYKLIEDVVTRMTS